MMELTETYYEKSADETYNIVLSPQYGSKYYIKKVDEAGNESYVERTYGDSVNEADAALGLRYHPLQEFFTNHICTSVPGLFFLPIHIIAFPIIITQIKRKLATLSEPGIRKLMSLCITLGALPYILVPVGAALFIFTDGFISGLGFFFAFCGEGLLLAYVMVMSRYLLQALPASDSSVDDRIRIVDSALGLLNSLAATVGAFVPLVYTIAFPILFAKVVARLKRDQSGKEDHKKPFQVFAGLGWTIWVVQIVLLVIFIVGLRLGRTDAAFKQFTFSTNSNITLSCNNGSDPNGIYWVRRAVDGNYSCVNDTSSQPMSNYLLADLTYNCAFEEGKCLVDLLQLEFAPNCTDIETQELLYTCAGSYDRKSYNNGWYMVYFCIGAYFGYNLIFFIPWAITSIRWIQRPKTLNTRGPQ